MSRAKRACNDGRVCSRGCPQPDCLLSSSASPRMSPLPSRKVLSIDIADVYVVAIRSELLDSSWLKI